MVTACRSLAKLQSAAVDAVKAVIAALDKFRGRLVAGLQDLDSVLAELTPARNRRQIAFASRRSCFLDTQGRDICKTQATSRLIAGHGPGARHSRHRPCRGLRRRLLFVLLVFRDDRRGSGIIDPPPIAPSVA